MKKTTLLQLFAVVLTLGSTKLCAQDTLVNVTPCSFPLLYSAEDFLLKEKVGKDLSAADANPVYTGGLDTLKKYFASHPLTDEKAKQLVFRVHIGFVVTCEGKAGNFFLLSKGKGDLETFALQVLEIVNKMPQAWQPAKKKKKAVDCYQVLSFTVVAGALDKVSYR